MSYISERRQEEKERRRAEILDSAEAAAAEVGWDAMTMDQVARQARLSRALVYVYFQDKTDLMFAVAERAMLQLRQRIAEAIARHKRGLDQVEAIGRAYLAFSQEFPLYFDILARWELITPGEAHHGPHQSNCIAAGDAAHDLIEVALATGIRDGSIRADVGSPRVVGIALWGFMHGVIQVATNKASVLAHRGVAVTELTEQALLMAGRSLAPPI